MQRKKMNFLEKVRISLGLSENAQKWMPIIIGIFTCALFSRIFVLGTFLAVDPGFIYDNDSIGYTQLALNLQDGNGFSIDTEAPYYPNSFRTPGYPLFLQLHHVVFGSFIPALVSQIVLSLLIGYLMLLIADRYMKIEIGIVAAAVFFFMPFSLLVTVRYLTQVVFTATIMLAVWYWLEYLSKKYFKYLLLTSVFLPIAALIRPIAIVIVVPFIASLVFELLRKNVTWRQTAGAAVLLLVVFGAGIAPWLWRNHETFGVASLSSIAAFQLYYYDDPAIYATAHGISYEEAKQILEKRIEKVTGFIRSQSPMLYSEFSDITPVLMKEGLNVAFENPPALIETRVVEFGKFFVRDGIRYWIERYGIDTSAGYGFALVVLERLVLALFTVGFFFAAVCGFLRKNVAIVFMTLIVLYFAVLTGVMASAGLRYPAEPLFLLIGTFGLAELYTLLRTKFKV